MKASTPIGIGIALGGLMLGVIMEGSSPMSLFNIPALIIICGGTLGATIASVGLDDIKNLPALYKIAMSPPELDPAGRRTELVTLADKARREGLLSLDEDAAQIEDPFMRKGVQLVVDGTDPDLVEEVMAGEISNTMKRHKDAAQAFEAGAGLAPTIGVLGTVMGLVHVLHNLSSPEMLGMSIAGAFIATLYGVGLANVVLHPINLRLKRLSAAEKELRMMTLEGILAIQAGENPRVVADKLASFLPPAARDAAESPDGTPGAVPDLEMAA